MSITPEDDQTTITSQTADNVWKLCTAGTLCVIWVGVLVISLFAPDLVSGSEHEHLPIAAFGTWLWGALTTGAVLVVMAKLRPDSEARSIWVGFSVVVAAIWVAATVL